MILTDKAKEDFLKWYLEKGNKKINTKQFSLDIAKSIIYAIAIEWFDSVGIFIETGGADYRGIEFWYNIQEKNTINGHNGEYFKSRQEATEKALEKANEIYNELKK